MLNRNRRSSTDKILISPHNRKAAGAVVFAALLALLVTPLLSGGTSPAPRRQAEDISQIVLQQTNPGAQSETERVSVPFKLPARDSQGMEGEGNSVADISWRNHTIKNGDSLYKVLLDMGYSPALVDRVSSLGDEVKPLLALTPGQILRVSNSTGKNFLGLEYSIDGLQTLVVKTRGSHLVANTRKKETETTTRFSSGVISSSLFLAATDAGMTDNLTMQLAKIFGWDIDFNLDLREGDRFQVLYSEILSEGVKISDGDILAAEFKVRGKTFQAVRFLNDDGDISYYTPDGKSMRKAFTRNPLPFNRVTSRFNPNRLHPVLKTTRPHRGVDYGAPTGTPVRATGDGKIILRGPSGGYGNTIIVKHGTTYNTLYAHLSRFASSSKVGSWVKQGQTIGFVGKTGLATGPHLHYEFRVNGVHKNPLTVAFPDAAPLPKSQRTAFNSQISPLLAQLKKLKQFETAAVDQ